MLLTWRPSGLLIESNASERSSERRSGNCLEDLERQSSLVILRKMASVELVVGKKT